MKKGHFVHLILCSVPADKLVVVNFKYFMTTY